MLALAPLLFAVIIVDDCVPMPKFDTPSYAGTNAIDCDTKSQFDNVYG